jgi:hypothetical protein
MSNLKIKSDQNLNAAQLLVNNNNNDYCNASIHCSYYGCFQFMKSILCNNINITYDIQDNNDKSSHDYIFKTLVDKINSPKIKKQFRVNFMSLKAKRKKADYLNELIKPYESLTAIEESKRVIYNLEHEFGKIKTT